jgi:hypothetical protein
MNRDSLTATTLVVLLGALVACESALPSRQTVVESRWQSFEEAKATFDQIELNETKREDLAHLGFDPYRSPNVTILTYMDIFRLFIPNDGIKIEQQDPGIQLCIAAREECTGLAIEPLREFDKEYGNFWTNFFDFRTKSELSGWVFGSTIVMVDDTVVYKLWEGNPAVLKRQDSVKPLGWFQDFNIDFTLRFP